MDGIDSFLGGERSLLSESDAFRGKNWRMIRMVAVVGANRLKVALVGRLRHCRGGVRGLYCIVIAVIVMALLFSRLRAWIMTYCCRTLDSLR